MELAVVSNPSDRSTTTMAALPAAAAEVRPENTSTQAPTVEVAEPVPTRIGAVTIFLGIICSLMVLYALYVTQLVVLPLMLAILLNLVLSPLIKLLTRIKIPEPVGAGLALLSILAVVVYGLYTLSGPAADWFGKLPATLKALQPQLQDIQRPLERAGQLINEITAVPGQQKASAEAGPAAGGAPLGFGLSVVSASGTFLFEILSTIVLLYFLLASGDLFLRKLVTLLPTFGDKKRAVEIAHKIQSDISIYLATITLINIGLGTAVAGALWATGLPNPPLWGGMVAVLNFVPYLGPLISFSVITLASVATFKTFGQAWPPPAAFLALVTIEGQFLTPTLAARRLTLNPIAIFFAVSFFGFLWSVPGALMAVPLLAVTKIVSDNMRALRPIGEFLGN